MTEDVRDRITEAFDAYAAQLTDPYQTVCAPSPSPSPSVESWVRRWAAPVAAAIVAAALIGGIAAVRSHSAGPTPAASSVAANQLRSKLSALARGWANATGDQGPVSASAVLTTRSRAEEYLGTGSSGSDAVWVVQVRGAFVCSSCKWAPGTTAPTGRLITVVLDAADLSESEFSIGDDEPELSTLGPPITLNP